MFASTSAPVTATGSALASAARALDRMLDAPHGQGAGLDRWRRVTRAHLVELRSALGSEADAVAGADAGADSWLAARSGGLRREGDALVARSAGLLGAVLGSPDVERLRSDLRRFLVDVTHHLQRRHDLAYDSVELELGGSE